MTLSHRVLVLVTAMLLAVMMLAVAPAGAIGQDNGRGATVERFVCFGGDPDEITLGRGIIVVTPSGQELFHCTA